jgi:hypothetical protein
MDSYVLPEGSARSFLREFRDCAAPDTNHVGGCPHRFDQDNQVNARFVLSATSTGTGMSWFVGDPSGGCGMSCYQPMRDRLPSAEHRPALGGSSTRSDADCTARISACMDSCQSSNSAIAKQCIDAGGEPIPPGMCTVNEDACSCSQTAPGCRKRDP